MIELRVELEEIVNLLHCVHPDHRLKLYGLSTYLEESSVTEGLCGVLPLLEHFPCFGRLTLQQGVEGQYSQGGRDSEYSQGGRDGNFNRKVAMRQEEV